MTSTTTRRIAGVSLLLLLAAFVIRSTREDLNPRVQELLGNLRAQLAAQPQSRRPAGGPAEAGRAWESYWKASDRLKARPASVIMSIQTDALAACESGPDERRTESARLASLIPLELALLRTGARRGDITPFPSNKTRDLTKALSLRDTLATSNLLGLLGVARLEAGDQAEGVAVLLDAMQISQDYSRGVTLINQMIGVSAVVPEPLLSALEKEGFGLFTPQALDSLELGLERLIVQAPRVPIFIGEVEQAGFTALLDPGQAQFPPQGFLASILNPWPASDELFIEAYELTQALNQASTLDAIGLLRAARRPAKQGQRLSDSWKGIYQSTRRAVVRLQMLQHAIRLAQGRAPAPFADPFEMPLKVSEDTDGWLLEIDAVLGASAISIYFHR